MTVILAGLWPLLASMIPSTASAADAPKDRVVVMYFHRTHAARPA